jgi:dihydroflavonol-4-reductase
MTGASGLLGIHTTRELIARGHEVVAAVRNIEKARRVLPNRPELKLVLGDLEKPSEMLNDLAGCDASALLGALFTEYYELGINDWDRFKRVNIDGTILLLREAKRLGHKKAAFVSSSGALADSQNELMNESVISDLYRRSKVAGEKAIRSDFELAGFPVIIVRPGWIFGPNDPTPTTTGRFSLELANNKKVEMVSGGPGPIVDARDVASGIALALENEKESVNFNLVGHNFSSGEMLRQIASHIPGAKVVLFPLPMAAFMSRLIEAKVKLFGGRNHMPLEGLRFLARPTPVDNSFAVDRLGLKFRSIEETAKDMATWAMERATTA